VDISTRGDSRGEEDFNIWGAPEADDGNGGDQVFGDGESYAKLRWVKSQSRQRENQASRSG
jgi:hypothetical protein